MTVESNKALIRRYVEEVYNKQDLDAYLQFVGGAMVEEGSDHLRQFFNAFPGAHTSILDMFGEGDKVVARLRINATNSGPFAGRPPTGKEVQFDSFRIYRFSEGKIVESWAMQDRLGLMQQLGFISAPGEVNWAAGDEE